MENEIDTLKNQIKNSKKKKKWELLLRKEACINEGCRPKKQSEQQWSSSFVLLSRELY